jgi:hypothetical protein
MVMVGVMKTDLFDILAKKKYPNTVCANSMSIVPRMKPHLHGCCRLDGTAHPATCSFCSILCTRIIITGVWFCAPNARGTFQRAGRK